MSAAKEESELSDEEKARIAEEKAHAALKSSLESVYHASQEHTVAVKRALEAMRDGGRKAVSQAHLKDLEESHARVRKAIDKVKLS